MKPIVIIMLIVAGVTANTLLSANTIDHSSPDPGSIIYDRDIDEELSADHVVDLGEWRVTEYCTACSGNVTASGKTPQEGMVAMNGVELGTVIVMDGQKYVVEDRCGIDGTVDIFREWSDGACHCSRLDYLQVWRIEQ